MREHDYEPLPGLPEKLPEGEQILWQGAPDWRLFARRTLHLPLMAAYFAIIVGARVSAMAMRGEPAGDVALDALYFLLPTVGVLALGVLYAWGVTRTTLYTLTNRRVVLRFGMALPVTANLPFAAVLSAATKLHADGSGDITLGLVREQRVSYLFFWPHARPWHFRRPQPSLRGLADAAGVARLLSRTLASAAAMPVAAAPSPEARNISGSGAQPAAA